MSPEDREKNRERKMKPMYIVLVAVILVVILSAVVYVDTFHGKGVLKGMFSGVSQVGETATQTESVRAKEAIKVDADGKTQIATFDKSFLLCTKDGVKYFDTMGDQRWSDTFTMATPQLISEGNFMAVADLSGRNVRVYDTQGVLYSVQTEGTVLQFAINESGYLSVIMKSNNGYRIQIYNASGVLLKGRVEEGEGVFPLSSDISDDNRAFVVSYLDTSDIQPVSRILFFYINPQDSETYTDSMFAAVEKPNEVIPKVAYMNGGGVVGVSDVKLYGVSTAGVELWNVEWENTVDFADLSAKDKIAVAFGDVVANKDGKAEGTVSIYSTAGKELGSYESGEKVTYLKSSDEGVVVGSNKFFAGIRSAGTVAWTYRTSAGVSDILTMESLNRVLVITQTEASVYDLRGEQSGATETVTQPEIDMEHEVITGGEETLTLEVPKTEADTTESTEETTDEGVIGEGVSGEVQE